MTPQRRPVAMVVPERERPGATANAWPIPTTNDCQKLIPFLYLLVPEQAPDVSALEREPKTSDKNSRAAVTRRQTATVVKLSPKSASTWSLSRNPTSATGIIETNILKI